MGNNAGLALTQTVFEDISDEQIKKVVDVNVWWVYPGIRVFLPHFRTRPEAVIVNAKRSMLPGRFPSIL